MVLRKVTLAIMSKLELSGKYFEISVAPMMDWTDRHCRYFHRLISPRAVLYTEMVTANAIKFGERDRILHFNDAEHPVVLQLGGSNPDDLAAAAKVGEDYGYDEINLNCGCPSDRVQEGSFGACLMKDPNVIAECIAAMMGNVAIPVTVKCRISIDDFPDEDFLYDFINTVKQTGCNTFIIHARKAWLKGLSPKENRDIPPLNYPLVYKVKRDFPNLKIIINGGFETVDNIQAALPHTDGVMIGRAAYHTPWVLADIEQSIFGNDSIPERKHVLEHMKLYAQQQYKDFETPVKSVSRHMMGLFHGLPGGRHWRRILNDAPKRAPDDVSIFDEAYDAVKKAHDNLAAREAA